MTLTVREVLLAAAETCERGWCQEAVATERSGRATYVESRRATCWCLYGGIMLAAKDDWDVRDAALLAVMRHLGNVPPIEWQDELGRTQAEVVAALRAAAEAQGGES